MCVLASGFCAFFSVRKYHDIKKFWGEKIYFTCKPKIMFHQFREVNTEFHGPSHIIATVKRLLPVNAQLPPIQLRAQPMEMVLPTFSMLLPISIKSPTHQLHTYRHIEKENTLSKTSVHIFYKSDCISFCIDHK